MPDHDNVSREIEKICEATRRGRGCRLRQALRQTGARDAPRRGTVATRQQPQLFQPADVEVESRPQQHFDPPANPAANTYTLLKFYSMTRSIAGALAAKGAVDVPFKVTDQEYAIIVGSAKESTLLIGRSGTGKTTCCVFKMFQDYADYWKHAVAANDALIPVDTETGACRHLRQVFVTKSPVLRTEVS